MRLFKRRKKTTRSPRVNRYRGDMQKLHIKVTSPRIVMFQLLRGIGSGFRLIMVFTILGLIAWGGYQAVQTIFIENEEYQLKEVNLKTNGQMKHTRLVEVTGLDLDASLFAIDTSDMQERLLSLPEVISCEVKRKLPGTLNVEIKERVPVVWIQSEVLGFRGKEKGGLLADAEGVTFPCEGALWDVSQELPVIILNDGEVEEFVYGQKVKNSDVERAINLVHEATRARLREQWEPVEIVIVKDYAMELVSKDGSRATFGMYEHTRQMEDFVTLREHAHANGREIEHMNLIPKKNIPVTFFQQPVIVKPRITH